MARSITCTLISTLALSLLASAAMAKPWDLVFINEASATLCDGCGITTNEDGFAILVNTGTEPLTVAEMDLTQFTATSSVPGVVLTPLLNDYGTLFTDLAPDHARGNGGRPLLTNLLHPAEILEDPHVQFLPFVIGRDFGAYEGPVVFHCTMDLAGEFVEFDILVHVSLGPHAYNYTSASRISSSSHPTPAMRRSWGRIKSRYR